MDREFLRRVALALLVVLGLSSPLLASVIPSKAEEKSAAQAREADLAQIEDLLARSEVARALAAQQPGADQALAQDTLGRILMAQGRCEDAVRVFQDALAGPGLSEQARSELLEGLAQARRACSLP